MRGGGHRDEERTKLRQETGEYQNPASYVRNDGAEFLFGSDYHRRREECWERDNRRCVTCAKLLSIEQMQMDHDPPRSQGGDDRLEKVKTSCSECHIGPKAKHL